jgi:hypothetical protein
MELAHAPTRLTSLVQFPRFGERLLSIYMGKGVERRLPLDGR